MILTNYFRSVLIIVSLQFEYLLTTKAIDENSFTIKSKYSVKETLDLIENDIKQQNGTIFCRIDQKKAAQSVGIVDQLDDNELILFGNPRIGTQLMMENGAISFELPLRASSWNKNGLVYLSVTNPMSFELSYNLTSKKDILQRMTENIKQIINKVSSQYSIIS